MSSQNEVAVAINSNSAPANGALSTIYQSHREKEKSDKWGMGIIIFGILFVLAYAAYSLMIFINTIIMFADGGWNEMADACGKNIRDTTLAMIIMMFLLGGGAKQKEYKKEIWYAIGFVWFITYGVFGSIQASERANQSDVCVAYLNNTSGGVNSPNVVLINQLVLSWLNVFTGIICIFIGFLSDE